MRKLIVFQHVAHHILGTFDPILKSHKLNIRYINFERTPEESPTMTKYNGLVILGGQMGVYESNKYQHIKVELKLIEQALKKEIPILGICLGSQLLAEVLGGNVRKHEAPEVGWCKVNFNKEALTDPLFAHFSSTEHLFQAHGDTFDIPQSAVQLASGDICKSQAFRFGKNAYGLQFHLEVDSMMIQRWLKKETEYLSSCSFNYQTPSLNILNQIEADSAIYLGRSLELSEKTFNQFVKLLNLKERPLLLGSEHAKPLKK